MVFFGLPLETTQRQKHHLRLAAPARGSQGSRPLGCLKPCDAGKVGLMNRLLGKLTYHLVMTNIAMENLLQMEGSMGKSSINGPFSMAMLNNQRVTMENYGKLS